MYITAGILIVAFVLAFAGIRFFIAWSRRREILDVPNERSSHTKPVPVGAGAVTAPITLLALVTYQVITGGGILWGFYIGAFLVAVVGWWDDIRELPPPVRITVHVLAALSAVALVGHWEQIQVPLAGALEIGPVGYVLTVVWIVGLTNAYNFMDGVDGIAGAQAVSGSIGWILTGYFLGLELVIVLSLLILLTNAAFLFFNRSPARVFLGDAGSGFLGYSFAVMPLLALYDPGGKPWQALFPLIAVACVWPFVFDSIVTFFRRLIHGEKVWRAHRSHIYQLMVIAGMSHTFVACFYGIAATISGAGAALSVFLLRTQAWFILVLMFVSAGMLLLGRRRALPPAAA